MAAGKYNMLVQQGATYNQTITLKDPTNTTPIDITGCTAAAQIREQYTDAAPVATFLCEVGGINGQIQISLTAAQTRDILIERGVYDIELTYLSGVKDRILQGNVVISKEVTK